MERLSQARSGTSPSRRLILRLLVHGEALLRSPLAYLKARYWLALGKRVRGHNQLSPLIGATRHAYAAWIAEHEQTAPPALDPGYDAVSMIVVIDARSDTEARDVTLRSVQSGSRAPDRIVVLTHEGATPQDTRGVLSTVDNVAGLARVLSEYKDASMVALRAGDCLSRHAIALFAQASTSGATVCYADDDIIDLHGNRGTPHFKPDWNAELYLHHDYISGAAAIRLGDEVLAAIATAEAQDWISSVTHAAVCAAALAPQHIHHVLVHRRFRPEPVVPTPITICPDENWPSLSVIIPTRNQLALLKACLAGLSETRYPVTECLIVDNGSNDPATCAFLAELEPNRFRVLRHLGPFNFSVLNNAAAREARGDYLCLLNNDVSMADPDWLHHLVRQARRREVGAVGARLHYPDGTVQHAGVVLGVGGGAAHAHRGLPPGERGYFHRADLPQFVSAVTAACLVVKRDKFLAVGGFDEEAFAVAFNDVDLCVRLNACGWQSLYEPRAQLLHHESKSRGTDLTPEKKARFAGELARLKQRWRTDQSVDPFHHPALSRFSDTFVIGL
jgi:GT2 family glycosyltransferase